MSRTGDHQEAYLRGTEVDADGIGSRPRALKSSSRSMENAKCFERKSKMDIVKAIRMDVAHGEVVYLSLIHI